MKAILSANTERYLFNFRLPLARALRDAGYEVLLLSLAEAAACGRLVVTTNVPGCREIVQDGVNGFLVPVRDSAALAEALRKLIGDPALRQVTCPSNFHSSFILNLCCQRLSRCQIYLSAFSM